MSTSVARRYSAGAGGRNCAAVRRAIPPGASPQAIAARTEATASSLILRVSFDHIFCNE